MKSGRSHFGNALAILSGLLLCGVPADAGQYSGLINVPGTFEDHVFLNFDEEPSTEMVLSWNYFSTPTCTDGYFNVYVAAENGRVATTAAALAILPPDTLINDALSWINYTTNTISFQIGCGNPQDVFTGPWNGVSSGLMAFAFTEGTVTNYGWLRLSHIANTHDFIVHEYRFEDTPLFAGDRPSPRMVALELGTNNLPAVTIETHTGFNYRIQYNTSLDQPPSSQWTNVGVQVPGDGYPFTYEDAVTPSRLRLYRAQRDE